MLSGEPVFQPDDQQATSKPTERPSRIDGKDVPEVFIDQRYDCSFNGNIMTCDAFILNNSKQIVFLDEIHMFGKKMELQRQLEPGERREFQIYNGPKIYGNYIQDCKILYRGSDGDYFASLHDIDCKPGADGAQRLSRIRFLPPIKDV